jgi:hypothetical protein
MQTRLEKTSISKRQELLVKNDYDKNDAYSAKHEDALSHPESYDKPLGKGTGNGGHTHSVPNGMLSTTSYNYSNIDTNGGGGSYDIHGRNGQGGRKFLQTINLYGPENRYGAHLIDTSLNQIDGQITL